jgi:hypothetical protein
MRQKGKSDPKYSSDIEAARQRTNAQEVFWAPTADRQKTMVEIRIGDGGS